jgi:phosphoglycolate phosphatase
MKKYKAVIFDIDGTILDPVEGVTEAVKHTIEQLGLKMLSDDQIALFVGPPIQNSFIEKYNLSENTAQKVANIFRNYYKNFSLLKAKAYDGIYDVFDELSRQKTGIGIATYKRQDYAEKLMEYFRFDIYCDSICGADNENRLAKPDIIKNCLNQLHITELTQAVMVGDSEHDALGAEEAGIDFIGVTYGFGFKTAEDVMKYRNVGYANSVEALRRVFVDV